MRKQIFKLAYILLIISLLFFNIRGQNTQAIIGIVVDEKKMPVVNAEATVLTFYDCKECPDELIVVTKTDEYGVFILSLRDNTAKEVFISIKEKKPKNLWSPIRFPSSIKDIPDFRTKITVPTNKEDVLLGEVPSNVRYKKVSLDLIKIVNSKMDILENDFVLTSVIKYKDKILKRTSEFPKDIFDKTKKEITFALPIGKWAFNFELTGKNTKIFSKVLIEVKENTQSIKYGSKLTK